MSLIYTLEWAILFALFTYIGLLLERRVEDDDTKGSIRSSLADQRIS